jgi:hypothetical protein
VIHHVIGQQVVVEIALGQAPDQLVQLRFRIGREAGGRQRSVIPVVTNNKALKVKRLA